MNYRKILPPEYLRRREEVAAAIKARKEKEEADRKTYQNLENEILKKDLAKAIAALEELVGLAPEDVTYNAKEVLTDLKTRNG